MNIWSYREADCRSDHYLTILEWRRRRRIVIRKMSRTHIQDGERKYKAEYEVPVQISSQIYKLMKYERN